MKYIKLLLASMFTFTAVIQSTEVGSCGTRRHRYEGIRAHFLVKNAAGVVLVKDATECGANWPELKHAIQFDLKAMQTQWEAIAIEQSEDRRLAKEAKELVGAVIKGE